VLGHLAHQPRRVGHLGVDLPGVRVALERNPELGERNSGLGKGLENDERRDYPGVRAVVVPEVVVARVLAAEYRAGLGHYRLDERVAHTSPDRDATALVDDLWHRVRADEVVEDLRAGMALEHGGTDDRGRGRSRDRLCLLVDQEHAVRVAVEGQADVASVEQYPRAQISEVLDLDRVGRMVWERTVQLGIENLELERKAVEDLRDDEAPMPLAVSATTFKGLKFSTWTNERTWAANSLSRSRCSTPTSSATPATPPSAGAEANASAATRWISPRPESRPIGRAPARQSLIPL